MAIRAFSFLLSFFIPPDGSKEGWDDSEEGDKSRDRFVGWLRSVREKYGLSWVEVQYGDNDYITKILRDSDEEYR